MICTPRARRNREPFDHGRLSASRLQAGVQELVIRTEPPAEREPHHARGSSDTACRGKLHQLPGIGVRLAAAAKKMLSSARPPR